MEIKHKVTISSHIKDLLGVDLKESRKLMLILSAKAALDRKDTTTALLSLIDLIVTKDFPQVGPDGIVKLLNDKVASPGDETVTVRDLLDEQFSEQVAKVSFQPITGARSKDIFERVLKCAASVSGKMNVIENCQNKEKICIRHNLFMDSLDYVEFVICLEEEFDIEISENEAPSWDNYTAMTIEKFIKIVESKV